MDGRSSTSTGLEPDDGGAARDLGFRILSATAHLDRAQEVLLHRTTHETQQARDLIQAAKDALGVVRSEEGFGGSEGMGEEDGSAAEEGVTA